MLAGAAAAWSLGGRALASLRGQQDEWTNGVAGAAAGAIVGGACEQHSSRASLVSLVLPVAACLGLPVPAGGPATGAVSCLE